MYSTFLEENIYKNHIKLMRSVFQLVLSYAATPSPVPAVQIQRSRFSKLQFCACVYAREEPVRGETPH